MTHKQINKKNMIYLGVAAGVFLVATGGVYVFNKWKATQPTQENFDRVVRTLLKKNHSNANSVFSESANRLCITVPSYPAPDSKSKAHHPLAWHLDFFSNATLTKDREKQLRQLDALTKVGLIKKYATTTKSNGELIEVTRYSLTEKGWAASGYSRDMPCFEYGTPSYLGISRFELKISTTQAGIELYEVHSRIGLSSEADLAPWARNQELQKEFPDIKKCLNGQEVVVLLARLDGEWVDYQSMLRDEVLNKTSKSGNQKSPKHFVLFDEMKRQIDELNALPAPTVDEVKKLLQAAHGVGQKNPWPTPCLDLPGSEKLPIDKVLFDYSPSHYSVAIFSNKTRTASDPVTNKTIPYLLMLEQLGVLSKHTAKGIPGSGKDSSTRFDGYIYELTPSYENNIHPTYPYCFPLGEPTVEFIDIQLSENDENGLPNSSFKYKLKVMYKSSPPWMNNPFLKDNWADLKGVLEQGRACQGQFSFDRKTRESFGGAGSCWWAFDSYYENY